MRATCIVPRPGPEVVAVAAAEVVAVAEAVALAVAVALALFPVDNRALLARSQRPRLATYNGRVSTQALFKELAALERHLQRKYRGTTIIFGNDGRHIIWGVLEVPRSKQNRGIGSQIASEVIAFAKERGLGIRLRPGSEGDLGSTRSRSDVVRFWSRLGFVESDGRDGYEVSEMYLPPARNGRASGRATYPQIKDPDGVTVRYLRGGCLDWADAFRDVLGGEYYGIELDGHLHHVVIKKGTRFHDVLGAGTAKEVLSFWGDLHGAKRRKLIPVTRKRLIDVEGYDTDETRYEDAHAAIVNDVEGGAVPESRAGRFL